MKEFYSFGGAEGVLECDARWVFYFFEELLEAYVLKAEFTHLLANVVICYRTEDYVVWVGEVLTFISVVIDESCPLSAVLIEYLAIELSHLCLIHFKCGYARSAAKLNAFGLGHLHRLCVGVGQVECSPKVFVRLGEGEVDGPDGYIGAVVEYHIVSVPPCRLQYEAIPSTMSEKVRVWSML